MQTIHFFTFLNKFLQSSMKYKYIFENLVHPILTAPRKAQN